MSARACPMLILALRKPPLPETCMSGVAEVADVAAVARELAPALDDLLFELSGDVRGELRSVLDAEA